jgi:Kef-type K+ transport system membrane component KefB
MSDLSLAIHFFFQLAVILIVCRIVGLVARRFGQPQVVGEMIAGVMLGPSLFGLVAPDLQSLLFPWDMSDQTRDTQSYLYPISQLGLALYMFIVGLEFRLDIVREHFKTSIAVSVSGMIAPFVLGAGLAAVLFNTTTLFPEKTRIIEAMLFLGASMCITAFPMLARIIHFKKLTGTRMGTVAIGAGAIDDAAAWSLLALVLASIQQQWSGAFYSIAGGVSFLVVTYFIVRPIIGKASKLLVAQGPDDSDTGDEHREGVRLTEAGLAIVLACMCVAAWFTDLIGLHAVFGAFVFGAVVPRGVISQDCIRKLQPLTVALLLPLFFTYSGLNTKIGLLNSWYLWGICGVILLIAMIGKGFACGLAAKLCGVPTSEAIGIGALMNARGLMELIIINIGLSKGIISEELFATLVIMAVATTLMTSPIFDWQARKFQSQ